MLKIRENKEYGIEAYFPQEGGRPYFVIDNQALNADIVQVNSSAFHMNFGDIVLLTENGSVYTSYTPEVWAKVIKGLV